MTVERDSPPAKQNAVKAMWIRFEQFIDRFSLHQCSIPLGRGTDRDPATTL